MDAPGPAPDTDRASRARDAGRTRGAGKDPLASRVMEFLSVPALFIAVNWAALLMTLTLVGLVPALAGAARTTAQAEHHRDDAFRAMWRLFARTARRDAPVSLAILAFMALGLGNLTLLEVMPSGARVFIAGILIPVCWLAVAIAACYVLAAAQAPTDASRREVAEAAAGLCMHHPGRTLITPALVIVLLPVVVLAPLTIACGLSLPAWVLARVWAITPLPTNAAD